VNKRKTHPNQTTKLDVMLIVSGPQSLEQTTRRPIKYVEDSLPTFYALIEQFQPLFLVPTVGLVRQQSRLLLGMG
jgi:hypothetical protein